LKLASKFHYVQITLLGTFRFIFLLWIGRGKGLDSLRP
jgi:hypothetical protein